MFRKYLTGQHILAVTEREKTGVDRLQEKSTESSNQERMMLRPLRAHAGGFITVES